MNQESTTTNSQLKEGYKQTEVGVIPEDWDVDVFQKVATLERGKFTARPRNDPKYYGGDIPFIQTGDVANSNGKITTFSQTLNQAGLNVSKLFPAGTLFFTIAANIGDVGFASFDTACPDSLIAIKAAKNTNKYWLFQELKSRKQSFENLATNNAQLNINLEKLRPYLLPIPPLAEQEAIAHTLSDIDALIESLDRLLTKKRQIKQGAMQELLRLKDGWVERSLGEVAQFFKGKGLPKSAIIPFATYPCIHYGELFTKYPETILNVQSRTNINTGVFYSVANDVLMPTSDVTPNGLATASCILEDGVILGGDILVIRIDPKELNGSFLSYLIRYSKKQIMQLISGTTVYHLYGSDMRKFSFWMPPIDEQIEIANILSDMDAEIGSIESKLAKTRQLKQGMMHELLTGRIRLVD